MPKSNVNNCSQLVRIFALSSCAFLLSDRTQFCSQTVRNFALGPYAILLSDRTQFCSQTVARTHFCSETAARTRDLPGHRNLTVHVHSTPRATRNLSLLAIRRFELICYRQRQMSVSPYLYCNTGFCASQTCFNCGSIADLHDLESSESLI